MASVKGSFNRQLWVRTFNTHLIIQSNSNLLHVGRLFSKEHILFAELTPTRQGHHTKVYLEEYLSLKTFLPPWVYDFSLRSFFQGNDSFMQQTISTVDQTSEHPCVSMSLRRYRIWQLPSWENTKGRSQRYPLSCLLRFYSSISGVYEHCSLFSHL